MGKKYTDFEFNTTLSTDLFFKVHLELVHPDLMNELAPYIRKENYIILKDNSNRLIEHHHLAAVISAYVKILLILSEWYGWAGDLATGFKEIATLKRDLGEHYVSDVAILQKIIRYLKPFINNTQRTILEE